ncbi:MAG TPA: response regulator transcription factor [Flavobacteriales bacterium]|jgi:DNA-binding NarL/FixJ family response regulator
MPLKIAIVEDDSVVRNNLQAFLASIPEYEVIGAYPDAESALQASVFHHCEVLLCDLGLPGMSGIELIRQVKAANPQINCIVLTVFEDDDNVFGALKAGATGYLLKGTRPTRIVDAIDEIVAGGSPMTGTIARKVMESFQQKDVLQSEILTERENEMLVFLSRGLRYKEIADALNISIETVRTHIRNIYQKLQVQSRTEAINKLRGL